MRHTSAISLFLVSFLVPFGARASGVTAPVRDFSFLWSSPYWSMSAMALILLWIVLIILYAGKHKEVELGSMSAMKNISSPPAGVPTTETYEVRRGDSLASIARQFNATREVIISLNAMTPPYRMKLGQLIKVAAPAQTPARNVDTIISHKEPLELPWSKDEKEDAPRQFQKPDGFSTWFKIFLWFIVVIVIVLGILFVWVNQSAKKQMPSPVKGVPASVPSTQEEVLPVPVIEEVSTATTTAVQQEPQPVPISVLNGGGASGAAKKLSDLMKAEGFEIATVGNADKFTYETTEVRYLAKDKLWAGVVESLLRLKGYEVVMVEKEELDGVVEVVIGKK